MRCLVSVLLLAALLAAPGCTVIMPSTANTIDQHLGNVQALNAKVQAAPTAADDNAPLPAWAKKWWAAEVNSWQWISDIAHWREPTAATTATTQPTE